jgi:hypothetical protein
VRKTPFFCAMFTQKGSVCPDRLKATIGKAEENKGVSYRRASTVAATKPSVVGWRPGLVDSGTLATLMEFAGSYGAEQRDGEHFHSRSMLTDAVGMDDRTDNRTMLRHMRPEGWTRLHSGATSHPSSHSTAPRHTLGCQRGTHLILRATVVLF